MPTTLTEVFTADDNEYGIVDVEAVDAVTVTTPEELEAYFASVSDEAIAAERRDTIEAYAYLARHDAEEALGDWNVDAPALRLRRGQRVCQTA